MLPLCRLEIHFLNNIDCTKTDLLLLLEIVTLSMLVLHLTEYRTSLEIIFLFIHPVLKLIINN